MLHLRPPHAAPVIFAALAKATLPRKARTVSQWADSSRRLSSKGSAEPGPWRTWRNPPLQEPMDALSKRSSVRDVVLKFPIQFGKTEVAINALGYTMTDHPGPVMVCLPGEVSMNKWVQQKLQPMIDETPDVRETLTSVASREASNTRTFKDYVGGQLYIEHAGSPSRLKSTSVRFLIVDELDEFAVNLVGGDDPVEMLDGRTSAFPATSKRLYISTPQIKSTSRIDHLFEKGDQRRWHCPCPHCGHEAPLSWSNWSSRNGAGDVAGHQVAWSSPRADGSRTVWLVCSECGAHIEEHHKTPMVAAGHWVPHNPGARTRSYTINCLYYPIGLGPRWAELVEKWLDAQGDPARLKTFINDRLAESWEDASTRSVKANIVAERAEPYALRTAPMGVLRVTAGVDTQDNRLAVQIKGWGRRSWWVLDYIELTGDPAQPAVWDALTELLNRPIQHACGAQLSIEACAIDAGGHRTEDVKAYVRDRRVRRPMVIFGAVPNNAPILGKGKLHDVNWKGVYDKRGVMVYQVGTVAAKHVLYATLAADADSQAAWELQAEGADKPEQPARMGHFTDQLPQEYFPGLISEVFNPSKNRFEKRRGGVRNEPLDTWVYAHAAGHHPELRLHRATRADWDKWEQQLLARAPKAEAATGEGALQAPAAEPEQRQAVWHNYRNRQAASPRQRGRK